MARSYARFAAAVFLVFGLGGLLTGDASHIVKGTASGNFGTVALHLTYGRDLINLGLAAAFIYAGFLAPERTVWIPVLAAGAVLMLLAVIGFIHADNDAGSITIASLHFPLAINVFDLVAGVLSVLCAAGGFDEEEPAAASA